MIHDGYTGWGNEVFGSWCLEILLLFASIGWSAQYDAVLSLGLAGHNFWLLISNSESAAGFEKFKSVSHERRIIGAVIIVILYRRDFWNGPRASSWIGASASRSDHSRDVIGVWGYTVGVLWVYCGRCLDTFLPVIFPYVSSRVQGILLWNRAPRASTGRGETCVIGIWTTGRGY